MWLALALVLLLALGLRLWGIRQGLPYAYNSDEDAHFVPRAIGMLTLGWNPHYFANPPAYTDLLRLVFAAWFGGRAGVSHTFAVNPTAVFTLARVCAALLGTLAVWLLYLAGARLFDRGVALLAAALEAVAFLPVFYAHLALNDVPTLAPLTLSLLGTAGVLRKGRARDYLLAGVGLGLGCATKYTAGIVLLPLLAAAAAQYLAPIPRRVAAARGGAAVGGAAAGGASAGDEGAGGRVAVEGAAVGGEGAGGRVAAGGAGRPRPVPAGRPVLVGLVLAGAAALVAFLVADPYSVLDFHAFEQGLAHQSSLSGEAQGKLGAPRESGLAYYLWVLTWGLGWVPAVAALAGAAMVWWRERRLGWVLVPAPLLYLLFMGSEGRYFGRWLLPIFPILCLLAAFAALSCARALARATQRFFERRTHMAEPARPAELIQINAVPARPRITLVVFTTLAVLALCVQGVVFSVHSGLVLARADTRALARAWMVAHVPVGAKVVVEPVVPDEWVQDVGRPTLSVADGDRWLKYQSLRSRIGASGALLSGEGHVLSLENYELTLAPALIPFYEREGYCWVLSGSAESARAFADPARAPLAVAYYRALARAGEVVYHVSPYAAGARPVAFNFDWSFDYYPLAYARPGPEVVVYRLRGGRCAGR
ncbi:MAG TPA: glycosyltransferase family 39 protein [Solirubrobacteraceae bacterium]|nr:glycosyltransferase family 39 protein [Solirubrobacteraceae bacterium]